MHEQLPFMLALVAAIVLIEMLATRLRVAYPVLLVVGGLMISFVPGLPRVQVDPDLIFFIFLPPLLFEAAWSISFKEMKRWWRIIGSFAFLVVLFSALAVAVATNFLIPGFTLALGFLLGGIVSPPDAVSTGAIMKFVRVSRSTAAILEGESLLNDASSLIIFRFALAAVATGQFVYQDAILSFSWMVIGGVGLGLLFGWLFMKAHQRLPTDAPSDIVFTLIEPYFLYWIAEQLHSSGVLAVVSGGLFLANRRLSFLTSASRVRGYSFWEALIFIMNGIVFMLIGLALPEVVEGLKAEGTSLSSAIGYGAVVTGVLILARLISSYAALLATLIFRPSVAPNRNNRQRMWRTPLLLSWTGMRGVVSLAAALAIPITLANGEPFPHRNLILFVTFVVILSTLLLQGLTLPFFIRRSGIFDTSLESKEEEERKGVKALLVEERLRLLKEIRNKPGGDSLQHRILQWEKQATQPEYIGMDEVTRNTYLDLLEAQRRFLSKLNNNPEINDQIILDEVYLIDLEEERIKLL